METTTIKFCSRCRKVQPIEKFSQRPNGSYYKQCDYHRKQDRTLKRRDSCLTKLSYVSEDDIREPDCLQNLIYMIQEVRFHFADRMKAAEARLDYIEHRINAPSCSKKEEDD